MLFLENVKLFTLKYIGNSTKNEIEFAKSLNKEIIYYIDR